MPFLTQSARDRSRSNVFFFQSTRPRILQPNLKSLTPSEGYGLHKASDDQSDISALIRTWARVSLCDSLVALDHFPATIVLLDDGNHVSTTEKA